LCPFLSEQCDEDGGAGEKGYPPKDLQGVDVSADERERKDGRFKQRLRLRLIKKRF
jgi:hypothetical protein